MMASRHKKETRDMEGKVRAMLKKAKKPEKKSVEAETKKLMEELKARQVEELVELEAGSGGGEEEREKEGTGEFDVEPTLTPVAPVAAGLNATDKEADAVARKRAKATRARERKKEKEDEAQREKEAIRAGAGPSMREVELDALNDVLGAENLTVKEVASDGNCMYRSIADQLVFTRHMAGSADGAHGADAADDAARSFYDLRALAADYLRQHPDDFAPFMMLEAGGVEYADYCDKVQSTSEWGSQVELRALAAALQRQLWVYDAAAPVVKMGDEFTGEPLKLTFHRHYYSLGDHYNSVKPLSS
jgi:OTU domain-containing protein 6